MDVIRAVLLAIEAQATAYAPQPSLEECSADEVAYQLKLLLDAGYVSEALEPRYSEQNGNFSERVYRLTWAGHEFLEAVRDPVIWRETKSGLNKLGGWTISILAELAKGLITQKAQELGLPIGGG